jgi:hypothetical protein
VTNPKFYDVFTLAPPSLFKSVPAVTAPLSGRAVKSNVDQSFSFNALEPKECKNDITPHSHYSRLYLILQTTRHSTHTHGSSTVNLQGKYPCVQMSFWANVFLVKCPSGQMFFWANVFWENVFLVKPPSRQMLFWANVFWANVFPGNCLSGQMFYGQMSFWANVFWANILWSKVHLGKCFYGQIFSGQMSSGQMSFWANVPGQMSYGQMSCHLHLQ